MIIIKIMLIWFLISVPISLLIGRLLAHHSASYPVADDRIIYEV